MESNRGWGDGAEEQNRTVDTRIFSPLLYQLSYLGTGMSGVKDAKFILSNRSVVVKPFLPEDDRRY